MNSFFTKLKSMDWQHTALVALGLTLAVATAWQAQKGQTLVVDGIGVVAFLTSVAALFKGAPGAQS